MEGVPEPPPPSSPHWTCAAAPRAAPAAAKEVIESLSSAAAVLKAASAANEGAIAGLPATVAARAAAAAAAAGGGVDPLHKLAGRLSQVVEEDVSEWPEEWFGFVPGLLFATRDAMQPVRKRQKVVDVLSWQPRCPKKRREPPAEGGRGYNDEGQQAHVDSQMNHVRALSSHHQNEGDKLSAECTGRGIGRSCSEVGRNRGPEAAAGAPLSKRRIITGLEVGAGSAFEVAVGFKNKQRDGPGSGAEGGGGSLGVRLATAAEDIAAPAGAGFAEQQAANGQTGGQCAGQSGSQSGGQSGEGISQEEDQGTPAGDEQLQLPLKEALVAAAVAAAPGGKSSHKAAARSSPSQGSAPTRATGDPHSLNSGSYSRQVQQSGRICIITPITNCIPRVPAELLQQAFIRSAGGQQQQQRQQDEQQVPSKVRLVLVKNGVAVLDPSKQVLADVQPMRRSGGSTSSGQQQVYRLCGPQVAAMCDEHVGWEVVGLEPGGPPGRDGTHFNHQQQEPFVRLLLQDQSTAPASAGGTTAAANAVLAAVTAGDGSMGGGVLNGTSGHVGSSSDSAEPVTMAAAAAAAEQGEHGIAPLLQPASVIGLATTADATTPLVAGGTEAAVLAAADAGGAVPAVPAAAGGGDSSDAPAAADFWEAVAHVIQLCDDLKVRFSWWAVRVVGTL
jgi:hypothetical protein